MLHPRRGAAAGNFRRRPRVPHASQRKLQRVEADADRRPAPQSEGQEPRQPPALSAPRQGRDPRRDQGFAAIAQDRRDRKRREGHDPLQEPARAVLRPGPQLGPARLRAAGQRGVQGRRRDPQAAGRRRRPRQPGQRRRRGPGRLHLHAHQGRVPRPLLRRPEAAEPHQGQAQGPQGAAAWCAPATPPTARRPSSTARAPCARASDGAWRCGARARPRSKRLEEELAAAEAETPPDPIKIAEVRGAPGAQAAAAPHHRLHRSDRPAPTTASTACPSPPPRRSCSA